MDPTSFSSFRRQTTVPVTRAKIIFGSPGSLLARQVLGERDRHLALEVRVRLRDHVHGDELADLLRGGGAGVAGGLAGGDLPAEEHGHETGAHFLVADDADVGGLHGGVGGFHAGDEAARLDHSECVHVLSWGQAFTYFTYSRIS